MIYYVSIGLGVFLGSFGYIALIDLFHPRSLRRRLANPEINWLNQTQLALFGKSAILIAGAIILIYSADAFFSLKETTLEKTVYYIFLSLQASSGGFELAGTLHPNVMMSFGFIVLMLIGASSGGTGGGIRTSLIYILINQFRKSDSNNTNTTTNMIMICWQVFYKSILFVLLISLLIRFSYPDIKWFESIFLSVSAFSNVGWEGSVNIDSYPYLKFLLSIGMLVGRIGVIGYIAYLSNQKLDNKSLNRAFL